MKKGLQVIIGLTVLAALAEGLILVRIQIDPWRSAALLESVALLLGAFVGLTDTAFVRHLRHWATASPVLAGGLPFLVPRRGQACGTGVPPVSSHGQDGRATTT